MACCNSLWINPGSLLGCAVVIKFSLWCVAITNASSSDVKPWRRRTGNFHYFTSFVVLGVSVDVNLLSCLNSRKLAFGGTSTWKLWVMSLKHYCKFDVQLEKSTIIACRGTSSCCGQVCKETGPTPLKQWVHKYYGQETGENISLQSDVSLNTRPQLDEKLWRQYPEIFLCGHANGSRWSTPRISVNDTDDPPMSTWCTQLSS